MGYLAEKKMAMTLAQKGAPAVTPMAMATSKFKKVTPRKKFRNLPAVGKTIRKAKNKKRKPLKFLVPKT